jgi:hypothetical protein
MRRIPASLRVLAGILAGAATSAAVVTLLGGAMTSAPARHALVPEDASGHLHRIAIHYAPALDVRAMPVWRQLFRVLPADVEIEVAVERAADFARFTTSLRAARIDHLERFHAVVVGQPLTTWSRDRMAALVGDELLAPPRVAVGSGARAGDWSAPWAIARDAYGNAPRIAEFVFEGGDLAASRGHVFADANLIGRNLGRGDATQAHLADAVARTFSQDLVWLGDAPGEVPEHHIMMYMVPLDDHAVLVGDVRMGLALLPPDQSIALDPEVARHAARFDHVAALLAARGFAVTRVPVVVLPGAGSYVTYTNALFDRDAAGPVVYLPTYEAPALDAAAARIYRDLGYRVVPIDVASIYQLNGSLGCLVNVRARVAP